LTRATALRQASPVKYLYTFKNYRTEFGIYTQETFHNFSSCDADYEQADTREMDLVGSSETKRSKPEGDRHLSTRAALS
jgi:hypothetical protein